jgi:glutamate/tyrosine decarboxylase-like PLP-dependent enzyme
MNAPYLRGILPSSYDGLDFLEYGPEMSRGFRALKVWMTLRQRGIEGVRSALRTGIANTRRLHELVTDHPEFEAAHDPSLYLYCFRYRPADLGDGASDDYLDRLNQRVAEDVQRSGLASVMTTRLRGRIVLRLSICSHRTRLRDIETVFAALAMIAKQAHRSYGGLGAQRGVASSHGLSVSMCSSEPSGRITAISP